MIAVLLGSRVKGKTSWVTVRGRKRLHARGLREGDLVTITLSRNRFENESKTICEDCILDIEGSVMICAEHVEASGSSVFIDLR